MPYIINNKIIRCPMSDDIINIMKLTHYYAMYLQFTTQLNIATKTKYNLSFYVYTLFLTAYKFLNTYQ